MLNLCSRSGSSRCTASTATSCTTRSWRDDVGVARRPRARLRGRRRRSRSRADGADVERRAVPAGLHVRRRHRRRHRPRRAARPAHARRGRRRRRDRHRRLAAPARSSPAPRSSPGAGCTRPRPRTCSRTRSRSVRDVARRRDRAKARPTSRRCAATPRRSLGRFIDERTRRRPDRDPGRHGSLTATSVAGSTSICAGRTRARHRRRQRRRRRDRAAALVARARSCGSTTSTRTAPPRSPPSSAATGTREPVKADVTSPLKIAAHARGDRARSTSS